MYSLLILCVLCATTYGSVERPEDDYTWEEKWFEGMPVDHFSFGDHRTFRLRYLINTQWWDSDNAGPIFFYCGNELAIESFANATGFMWDEAPKFNAMLLFIEHRYYGKSLPFGEDSGKSLKNVQHLSSMQALADFAVAITQLKQTIPGAAHSPVIAFGGSYGAQLAAWMRIKYPHIITGALSSSGPILQFSGLAPCHMYHSISTRDYAQAQPGCDKVIRKSWPALRRMAQTDLGRDYINHLFNPCSNYRVNSSKDIDGIIGLVSGAMTNMAMLDYPYPTFFVKPLPTYPVNASCAKLNYDPEASDEDLAQGLQKIVNIFYNTTGNTKCLAGDDTFGLWGWQVCNEIVLTHCSREQDMFEPFEWNPKQHSDECAQQWWGTRPRYQLANIMYGNANLTWATNIIFTNGDLDPWAGGGVTKPYPGMDPSVHIINIKRAAHHLDLRAEHPLDPIWVRQAREHIRAVFREWVQYKF